MYRQGEVEFSSGFDMRALKSRGIAWCLLMDRMTIRGYIIALVAFVWLFSSVCFQMFLYESTTEQRDGMVSPYGQDDYQRIHNSIGCICLAFLQCVFSNVFI